MAFIFEDDADFVDGAAAVLDEISSRPADWDILKLYSNKPKRLRSAKAIDGAYAYGLTRKIPMSTIGYAITREAASHLAATSLPFSRPLDIDLKFWWDNGICIKTVQPSLCFPATGAEGRSSITPDRRASRRDRSFTDRFFRNLRYQVVYNWLIWHNSSHQPSDRQCG